MTMLPAMPTPRDSFVTYPPRGYQYRPVWVPSMVRAPASQSPLFRPAPTPRANSPDELCAASVLLNLSPKDGRAPLSNLQLHSSNVSPYSCPPHAYPPRTISVPTQYSKRWGSESGYFQRSDFDPSTTPPPLVQVSDNSLEGTSAESERGSSDDENHSEDESSLVASSQVGTEHDPNQWEKGSTSLSLPEDSDVLSPLHCFMRRYCVEAFSATPEDVATPRYGKSHGVKVVVGQVGIRCLYCKHREQGKRPERSVCYPSSLKNIYHSMETWQRRHCLVCSDIPQWVRKSIVELMESSKCRAGGRRQYWEDSAKRLGMVDTSQGVRFTRTPGDLGPLVERAPAPQSPSSPVVRDEDRDLVTNYLFLLMEQMETCQFAEEDRTGGRSKIKDNKVGFPGMQCKHCQGKAGFGRYFPANLNALALANSDRNIYNHLQKCRRCPTHVKTNLLHLLQDQGQNKNRRGLRKMFFQRVWARMHNNR